MSLIRAGLVHTLTPDGALEYADSKVVVELMSVEEEQANLDPFGEDPSPRDGYVVSFRTAKNAARRFSENQPELTGWRSAGRNLTPQRAAQVYRSLVRRYGEKPTTHAMYWEDAYESLPDEMPLEERQSVVAEWRRTGFLPRNLRYGRNSE